MSSAALGAWAEVPPSALACGPRCNGATGTRAWRAAAGEAERGCICCLVSWRLRRMSAGGENTLTRAGGASSTCRWSRASGGGSSTRRARPVRRIGGTGRKCQWGGHFRPCAEAPKAPDLGGAYPAVSDSAVPHSRAVYRRPGRRPDAGLERSNRANSATLVERGSLGAGGR